MNKMSWGVSFKMDCYACVFTKSVEKGHIFCSYGVVDVFCKKGMVSVSIALEGSK